MPCTGTARKRTRAAFSQHGNSSKVALTNQHLNFIGAQFLFPEVKETAIEIALQGFAGARPRIIRQNPTARLHHLSRQHHTVLDPTISIFEGLFCGNPARSTPHWKDRARFPPQCGGMLTERSSSADKQSAYHEAFPAMLRLLKATRRG